MGIKKSRQAFLLSPPPVAQGVQQEEYFAPVFIEREDGDWCVRLSSLVFSGSGMFFSGRWILVFSG
jgi:hypothetical protein